jgi:prephenate dehydrogenase
VLGVISHLPHVLVYALVNALERHPPEGVDLKKYCAGGFKDFTRIASSRPELWRDVCLMNRRALSRSLGDYIKDLQKLNSWIRGGKGGLLERDFARAYQTRALSIRLRHETDRADQPAAARHDHGARG